MQTKDQNNGRRDWKVIATVATASALGLSGLALADSNDGSGAPDPIDLEDRTPVTEVTVAKSTATTLADLGITVSTLDSASSPFDDPAPTTTVANSAASAASPEVAPAPAPANDSPDPAPAPAPAPEPSADSPDPAPAPPADDSASAASAGSVGSSADS